MQSPYSLSSYDAIDRLKALDRGTLTAIFRNDHPVR